MANNISKSTKTILCYICGKISFSLSNTINLCLWFNITFSTYLYLFFWVLSLPDNPKPIKNHDWRYFSESIHRLFTFVLMHLVIKRNYCLE